MKKLVFIVTTLLVFAIGLVFVSATSAQTITQRLSGQILIQVEEAGEAWYVYPGDNHRYFLGRPADAFALMRNLSLGVATDRLVKIPIGLIAQSGEDTDKDGLVDLLEEAIGSNINSTDSDGDGYLDREEVENWYSPIGPEKMSVDQGLIDRLKGLILLQVESRGEAWYLFPDNGKKYFLGRPDHAFQIMRDLGLGITNADLAQVPISPNSAVPPLRYEVVEAEPELEAPAVVSCGEDIICMSQAADSCQPSEAFHTVTLNWFGVEQTTTSALKIIGQVDGACEFYIELEQADLVYSSSLIDQLLADGVPMEAIENAQSQSNIYLDGLEGAHGTCELETEYLSEMFERWDQGHFSTEDWEGQECTGDFFYSQE